MSLNKVHSSGASAPTRSPHDQHGKQRLHAQRRHVRALQEQGRRVAEAHRVAQGRALEPAGGLRDCLLDEGPPVHVEGKIQTRAGEGREKRYATEIVAHHVNVLDSNPTARAPSEAAAECVASRGVPAGAESAGPDYGDDDPPF